MTAAASATKTPPHAATKPTTASGAGKFMLPPAPNTAHGCGNRTGPLRKVGINLIGNPVIDNTTAIAIPRIQISNT